MINHTKKLGVKKMVITLFIFFGLITASGCGSVSSIPSGNNTEEAQVLEQEEVQASEQVAVVFDVETLYGRNVDEIISILGEPKHNTEPRDLQINIQSEDQLAKEWDKSWEKDGYALLVTYDVASREVIDFFVSTDDPSGLIKDIEKLKKILNVQNSTNFTVKPVKALMYPSSYTGITVVPIK